MSKLIQVRNEPCFAHIAGYTNFCFSENGTETITCGSDGDVRIVRDSDSSDVCVGTQAFSVVQKNDKLYVGTDHNYVQILTYPEGNLDIKITRFTAPVNTLDISRDGKHLVAGSSDTSIQIIDVETSSITFFEGHKAPILHVAIDPKMEYLSSSSCDGTVRMWKISDQSVQKEWTNVLTKSNSFLTSKTRCQLSWEPLTGRLFAIPFHNEIKLVQRSTWNDITSLTKQQISGIYSLTSWSECGRYLAAATTKGDIYVWNTLTNVLMSVSSSTNFECICSLKWHPSNDSKKLAFCDNTGYFSSIDLKDSQVQDLNTDIPTSNNEETEDNSFTEYAADDGDDDNMEISLDKIKANYTSLIEGNDLASESGKINGNHGNDDDDDDDLQSVKSDLNFGANVPAVELQLPFQPTSMPVHLQRRFMIFNDVGYVRHINTDDENTIDVDFHDISIHHPFRINNLCNYTMGALNAEGVVLASEKTEEACSKLHCRMLRSWDSNKEWFIDMDEDESIEAIAVGNKWIAASTSSRFLRFFTLSGIQREILCVSGPILCMNGYDDLLIVVHHASESFLKEQIITFTVYRVTHTVNVLVATQPLPISSKSTLKWVGFSDWRNPCTVDSNGILRLFSSSTGLWRPICALNKIRKNESVHHFVIGVSEQLQNIRCLICRGSYYPSTTPHPFMNEVPYQIPVCEIDSDKGQSEEKYWRNQITKECVPEKDTENKSIEKEMLAAFLQLISLSAKRDRDMRGVELCEIANSSKATELAIKYAARVNRNVLLQKLEELKYAQNESANQRQIEERETYSYTNSRLESFSAVEESQELFPSDTCSSSSATNSGRVSLIEETRKRVLFNGRNVLLPPRKKNPFKKSIESEPTQTTSISESKSDSTMLEEKKKESLKSELASNGISSAPSSSSEVPETIMNDSEEATVKNDTNNVNVDFPTWFRKNKASLSLEYPKEPLPQLAKIAATRYRTLRKNSNFNNGAKPASEDVNHDSDTSLSSNKKRKPEEVESSGSGDSGDVSKKKNRLSSFAFQKIT